MAAIVALNFTPSLNLTTPPKQTTAAVNPSTVHSLHTRRRKASAALTIAKSFKVVIEHDGQATELDVDPDESILSKALDVGLSVPHDCKLGVCMTCPARLISGSVDQSEGMLSDDVVESGYALLCAAYPRSDCRIRTIQEDELLLVQLATGND